MNCEHAQAQLTALRDGEISSGDSSALEAHLKLCESCSSVRDETAAVLAAADSWRPGTRDVLARVQWEIDRQELRAAVEEIGRLKREVTSLRADVADLSRRAEGGRRDLGLGSSVTRFPYQATRDVPRPIV